MNSQTLSRSRRQFWWAIKRLFDITISTTGMIVGFPFFVLAAFIILRDSPGPVLYRQLRVGRGGALFAVLKFRTMVRNAEELLTNHLEDNPDMRLSWDSYQKLLEDPRLTRTGRWLRRTSLDELPQLWNVFLGEMSLVGPRPILPEQIDEYGPHFQDYLRVPPGMTGLWQVSGRNCLAFSERAGLDHEYIRSWSLWLDIVILAKTVGVVLRKEGAF